MTFFNSSTVCDRDARSTGKFVDGKVLERFDTYVFRNTSEGLKHKKLRVYI
jgi:hypothetical protein